MKKLLLILGIITSVFLFTPVLAGAEDIFNDVCQNAADSAVCKDKGSAAAQGDGPLVGPKGIITRVTQLVVFVAGIAGVLMVIIAGIRYVMSSGDPQKIDSAKNAILFAVIGLVIAASAQVLVSLVFSQL